MMTDCATLFACMLLLVVVLIMVRNSKAESYMDGKVPYGLDPKALAVVTGVKPSMEYMSNKGGIDQIAMAATLARSDMGRVNTESNPKLLSLMMDPRYMQYGRGRGGIYHY